MKGSKLSIEEKWRAAESRINDFTFVDLYHPDKSKNTRDFKRLSYECDILRDKVVNPPCKVLNDVFLLVSYNKMFRRKLKKMNIEDKESAERERVARILDKIDAKYQDPEKRARMKDKFTRANDSISPPMPSYT